MRYLGIDEREIECCSSNPNSIQSGISFEMQDETPVLRFHFLQKIQEGLIMQTAKNMHLNNANIRELIDRLQEFIVE